MLTKLYSESFLHKLSECKINLADHQMLCDDNVDRAYHLRNNGLISYCPKNKECKLTDNGAWSREGRIEARAGKVIRTLCERFSIVVSDSDVERAVNSLKAICDDSQESKDTFEIVAGPSIHDVYNMKIGRGTATLENSCMNGKRYFDIYCNNPAKVKMLILKDANGLLIGRSLLWFDGSITYMDRIYGNDVTVAKFINYAKSEGYAYKAEQSYGQYNFILPGDDEPTEVKAKINLNIDDLETYPYIDTFRYLHSFGLATYKTDNYLATLDNTDGTGYETIENECYGCGSDCGEDYRYVNDSMYCCDCAGYDELNDEDCLQSDLIQLVDGRYTSRENSDVVSIGSRYYHVDDDRIIYVESESEYYLIDDVTYCEYNEEYYLNDDVTYLDDLNMSVHNDDVDQAYENAGWIKEGDVWYESKDNLPSCLLNTVNDPAQIKIDFEGKAIRIGDAECMIHSGTRGGKYIIRNGNKRYLTQLRSYKIAA